MYRFLILLFIILPLELIAQKVTDWDRVRSVGLVPGKTYDIESGTGFFVNQNYIVTNEHVLRDCLTISVRGAVEATPAALVATDKANDLALIYVDKKPKDLPFLRSNDGLKTNDSVFIIGYPLDRGETGEYLLVKSKIIGFEGSKFLDAQHIEFVNSVEHGNSGGPLLDNSGNVVGVVVAKKITTFEETNPSTGKIENSYSTVTSVAIGLKYLKEFLQRNKIIYFSTTTYDIYQDVKPDKRGQNYIVNIHCVKEVDNNN